MAHPRSFAFLTSLVSITALAIACASEFKIDQPNYDCDKGLSTCAGAGNGGNGGGSNGNGGVTGEGGGGAGGDAGAGAGGGEPQCQEDKNCSSLCIAGRCVLPANECVPTARIVVADRSLEANVDAAYQTNCFYRSLDGAIGAVSAETETIVIYANSIDIAGNLTIAAGLKLEGHAIDPSKGVTFIFNDSRPDEALITMSANSSIKGVTIVGDSTSPGIRVTGTGARLEGPIELSTLSPALTIEDQASATVTGSATARVLLTANTHAIVVQSNAGLTLQGDGEGGGVTVDGTTGGAGILIRNGNTTGKVLLDGLLATNNTVDKAGEGQGPVTIEPGRDVDIQKCSFQTSNQWAITLDGTFSGGSNLFNNVDISNNIFAPASGKSPLCGVRLVAKQSLKVSPTNTFPNAGANCPIGPNPDNANNCSGTTDVGYVESGTGFLISCMSKALSQSIVRLNNLHPLTAPLPSPASP